MSSAWFQLPVHNGAPPSLHGVGRAVPPLQHYYGALRLLAALLAALRFLRLAIPSVRPQFVPTGSGREPWINLELVSRDSSRQARWRRKGLPSSRETRSIIRQCSSDPGVTRQAEWTTSELPGSAPATDQDEGSRQGHFGAQSHSV